MLLPLHVQVRQSLLKELAHGVTHNNPDASLMVLLVDERPEEVTDMQRSVKGEVYASTFDLPAQNHVRTAEMVIEKAKRRVEMGKDVVILIGLHYETCTCIQHRYTKFW